jgi:ERCC4-type nuclease
MTELVVDMRENKLILLLKAIGVDFKTEMLDLGDIVFRTSDGNVLFIIERKTINDLKASICDGRLREQKARLMSNFDRSRIMYLIEGEIPNSIGVNAMGVVLRKTKFRHK